MKAVYAASLDAGIDPPQEVEDFFEGSPPDPAGVEVPIEGKNGAVTEWQGEESSGYEVDIRKLPKDVHIIRFYNSW